MIPFGPWEPDKGPYNADTMNEMMNALPIANGWGPFPSLVAVSNALGSQCYGAWYIRSSDGSFRILAGTKNGLFRFNTTTKAWDSIGSGYTVPDGDMWQGVQYGPLFIVTNVTDGPQKYNVDAGGTFSALGGTPPKAKYICTAGDFLVMGYLRIGGQDYPQDIQWSGLNDAESWTVGTKSSDRQTLPDGDEVIGLLPFIGGARIFQRKARRALIFTGGQYVFQVKVIDATKGAIAPLAIVSLASDDYVFLREDGFYRGDANTPIGAQRVDSFFLNDIDLDKLSVVQGVSDPYNKAVLWRYQDGSARWKVIGYNWQQDRWFKSDVAAILLVSAATSGYSLEDLNAFGTLDTLPASLDSRVWKGGRPTVGAFLADNKMALFSGTPMAAQLETTSVELNPGLRTFVSGASLISNATNYSVSVAGAAYHGGAETFSSPVGASLRSGMASLRKDARLHRFRASLASHVWTHVHGIRPQSKPAGRV